MLYTLSYKKSRKDYFRSYYIRNKSKLLIRARASCASRRIEKPRKRRFDMDLYKRELNKRYRDSYELGDNNGCDSYELGDNKITLYFN